MIINGIDTKDISVVVQGAVKRGIIELCLDSIRTYLSGAEIILSTWEGTDVQGLDYDIVLLNKDPGGFDFGNSEYSESCNYERQQVSTVNGLKCANRKYSVKLRTDFMLTSAGFLKYFGKYNKRNAEYSFLREKAICCELFSRNPRIIDPNYRLSIHPSDFFYFGLTEDILSIFESEPITEEDKIYFAHKYRDRVAAVLSRFVPEQFMWRGFLKKFIPEKYLPADLEDVSRQAILITEKTIASNLVILSKEQIGLKALKNSVFQQSQGLSNCYSHRDWYALYLNYCCQYRLSFHFFLMKCVKRNAVIKVRERLNIEQNLQSLFWTLKPKFQQKLKGRMREICKRIYSFMRSRRRNGINYVESFLNNRVTADNISIIVQGAVSNNTKQCLKSIRKILPGAEIILSTWEGTNVEGLDYDKLVLSEDPGSDGLIRQFPHIQQHNVSREIRSTYNGLRVASRYYCMKLRSDMEIQSDAFLRYYNRYSKYISPKAIFDRRIMVEGLTTSSGYYFCIGDWWYFGTKHDIEKLFSIPLYEKEKVPFYMQKENSSKRPFGGDIVCKYIPEQYIIISCLRKNASAEVNRRLNYGHFYDVSQEALQLSKEIIYNNFICLESALSGVVLPKALNINNPCSYYHNLPFEKWVAGCAEWRSLPLKLTKKVPENSNKKMLESYSKSPQYYEIENYADVIKNYSKMSYVMKYNKCQTIKKSEITFVVTGLIIQTGEYNTYRCLASIKRFFARSKIILVTWKGQSVENIRKLCDEIILLEEPVDRKINIFVSDSGLKKINNINRQQYCVNAGIKCVKTKYTVRFRTDFYLDNDNFLSFYLKWITVLNKFDSRYRIFNQRILSYNYYTRDPRTIDRGYAYMLSDCFQFGLTTDLMQLWDGHLESFETLNYFNIHKELKINSLDAFNHQYTAEQYFLLNALRKKNIRVSIPEYYGDKKDIYVFEYEKIMSSNIVIGNRGQLGIESKFREYDSFETGLYTLEKLIEKYLWNIEPDNQYCLNYLKRYYTYEPVLSQSKSIGHFFIIGVKKIHSLCREAIKKMMRLVLPAYRVCDGMRGETFSWWNRIESQLNSLDNRLNNLQQALERNKERDEKEDDYAGNNGK